MTDVQNAEEAVSPFDYMSFQQIAAFMKDTDGRTVAKHGGSLTRRLYEIALYENHVSEDDRKGAHELLRIIKGTMEIVYSDSPAALAQYAQANAEMEDAARQIGVGSLSWLLIENNIIDDATMKCLFRSDAL